MAIDNFPKEFQKKSLETLNRLLPLSFSVFFLVDPSIRAKGVVLQDIDLDTDIQYRNHYFDYDPIQIQDFNVSEELVVCLDELLPEAELLESVYYREFMLPHNMRYVADIFLRNEGEIIADISLIRDATMTNFSATELQLLRNLQPLLEFSLNSIYKPKRADERALLQARFHLTDRELDVIEHIVVGSSSHQ